MNAAIAEADASGAASKGGGDLVAIAANLEQDAVAAKTPAEADRMRALAAIMKEKGAARP